MQQAHRLCISGGDCPVACHGDASKVSQLLGPACIPLRMVLQEFLADPSQSGVKLLRRCEVVRKRAERDGQRARARLHLVQGFLLAMNDLDKAGSLLL